MALTKALVLLSGGQDSTVCLGWALDRFDSVETIAFDYVQRHRIELEARLEVLKRIGAIKPEWSRRLSDDHSLTLAELGRISETSLTRDAKIVISESGLPSTFVPGRNLIFLTYAAAVACRSGIATLVGGMCETDYSGYPDCRNETMESLARTLSLGMDQAFEIQSGDLEVGARTRGRCIGCVDHRSYPHLLYRRSDEEAFMGLWVWGMPSL